MLLYLSSLSFTELTIMAYSFSLPSLFSSSISFTFSLPLLVRGLVTPVSVRGEALGHLSSSSQVPSTPLSMHSLVMVPGCGIKPLYLFL